MNKTAFLDIINHVSSISEQEVAELEKLALNFPYCQTAHLLLAKAAYDQGSMLSNQKLRRAAACAANRQLLKKLIYTAATEIELSPITPPETAVTVPADAPAEVPSPAEIFEPQNIEIPVLPVPVETSDESLTAFSPEYNSTEPELNVQLEITETVKADAAIHNTTEPATPELVPADFLSISEETKALENNELDKDETQYYVPALGDEDSQENQDLLFLVENLSPAAPYRDPVTDFISNLVYNEPESYIAEMLAGYDNDSEPVGLPATEDILPDADQQEQEIPYATAFVELTQNTAAEEPLPIEADTIISQFDAYLFTPEKEEELTAEPTPFAPYKEEIIYKIFSENELGYWMNSSRLGENLQIKDELTPSQPHYFQPDLILEYSQQHELESYLPPTEKQINPQEIIIDHFLKQNPKLKSMAHVKIKAEPMEDLSIKSTKIKKNLASETLANILIKQGKIKKAIKIYEHLILKIPDKKAYFASQIEKLQKLT